MSFSDCVVPASAMLGKEGKGFNIAMETLDGGRFSCSALALGDRTQSALDATIAYTKRGVFNLVNPLQLIKVFNGY